MPVYVIPGLDEDIHPTFAEQLGIQVSREIERILGVKGLQKWEIYIELFKYSRYINEGKPINFDGFSYIEISLVTKHADRCNILIRWKSLKEGVEYLALNDEVSAETIKFEVCEEVPPCPPEKLLFRFPTAPWAEKTEPVPPTNESINSWKQEILKQLYPLKREKKEKTEYRFDVYYYSPDWPDVFLELVLDRATRIPKENILEYVRKFINCWNDESEAKKREQYIHYVDILDSDDELLINLFVDFGSCKPLKQSSPNLCVNYLGH